MLDITAPYSAAICTQSVASKPSAAARSAAIAASIWYRPGWRRATAAFRIDLLAQIGVDRPVAAAGRVALVEDQVDDGAHAIEPCFQGIHAQRLEPDAQLPDLRLARTSRWPSVASGSTNAAAICPGGQPRDVPLERLFPLQVLRFEQEGALVLVVRVQQLQVESLIGAMSPGYRPGPPVTGERIIEPAVRRLLALPDGQAPILPTA